MTQSTYFRTDPASCYVQLRRGIGVSSKVRLRTNNMDASNAWHWAGTSLSDAAQALIQQQRMLVFWVSVAQMGIYRGISKNMHSNTPVIGGLLVGIFDRTLLVAPASPHLNPVEGARRVHRFDANENHRDFWLMPVPPTAQHVISAWPDRAMGGYVSHSSGLTTEARGFATQGNVTPHTGMFQMRGALTSHLIRPALLWPQIVAERGRIARDLASWGWMQLRSNTVNFGTSWVSPPAEYLDRIQRLAESTQV